MQRKLAPKAYKYRIYPTDAQVVFFAKTFGCCRFVWNKMLNEKLAACKGIASLSRQGAAVLNMYGFV
jgi:transposase